ncbi:MAG: hypothetical protein ABII96_08295, partial [Candidatus Zixiibacteriota bacterium]
MKKKLNLRIPRILFFGLAGFLFLLWLNSLVGFIGDFDGLTSGLRLDCQKLLASERDFHEALDESLYYDTLFIVYDSAAPGEKIWVNIGLHNTIPIIGWQMKLAYPSSKLMPVISDTGLVNCDTSETSPPCTTWGAESKVGYRTIPYGDTSWFVWTTPIWYKHLDTCRFTALLDIYGHPNLPMIPPDYGSIAQIAFTVSDTATPGDLIPINFCLYWSYEQSQTYPANTLCDTSGLFLIPITKDGFIKVKGGTTPGNHCPVFTASAPADSYQVNEGQTLQFAVTATDQDTDNVELSLSSITPSPPSANYHFVTKTGTGAVTQTFDYTPGYDEASPGTPTVRYATFRVVDDQQCATTKTVVISVINTVQDLLIASDKEGGVPGSGGVLVPFILTNSADIYGFQFTFRWDDSKLDVDSIVRTGAIDGFSMYNNLCDSAGKATVLVFGLAGDTIPAGVDTFA